jgi:hypothetical protein
LWLCIYNSCLFCDNDDNYWFCDLPVFVSTFFSFYFSSITRLSGLFMSRNKINISFFLVVLKTSKRRMMKRKIFNRFSLVGANLNGSAFLPNFEIQRSISYISYWKFRFRFQIIRWFIWFRCISDSMSPYSIQLWRKNCGLLFCVNKISNQKTSKLNDIRKAGFQRSLVLVHQLSGVVSLNIDWLYYNASNMCGSSILFRNFRQVCMVEIMFVYP